MVRGCRAAAGLLAMPVWLMVRPLLVKLATVFEMAVYGRVAWWHCGKAERVAVERCNPCEVHVHRETRHGTKATISYTWPACP